MQAPERYRFHLDVARELLRGFGEKHKYADTEMAVQVALVHATLALAAAVRGLDGTMMAAHDVSEF